VVVEAASTEVEAFMEAVAASVAVWVVVASAVAWPVVVFAVA
jgi:hypothetical protein